MPIPAGASALADPLDIISLGEAHAAISLDDSVTTHDYELAQFVTAVSRVVDDKCGPVVARDVSEVHDGGGASIIPRKWPVYSVTTVTEYRSGVAQTLTAAATPDLTTSTSYVVDTSAGIIRRFAGSGMPYQFWWGSQNIYVTYRAGRYDSTAVVDRKFKVAVQSILRRMWKRESGAWAQTPDGVFQFESGTPAFFNAVDRMVEELLGFEMKPPGIA